MFVSKNIDEIRCYNKHSQKLKLKVAQASSQGTGNQPRICFKMCGVVKHNRL